MSKLPDMIVKLSRPERDRWGGRSMYVTGIACTHAIADEVRPIVSSYVNIFDGDNGKQYLVNTRYCLDSSTVQDEDVIWFTWENETVLDNMKDAIKLAESRARGCYSYALEFGLAQSLTGFIHEEE